jgi:small conductance mechanosensitive channel
VDAWWDAYGMLVTIAGMTIAAILIVRTAVRRRGNQARNEWRWQQQAWTLAIGLAGLLAVLFAWPDVPTETVLGVVGLAFTAIIALSASTLVSNAMAGLMLHAVGNFRPGDFVRVDEHFGRVTERRLFHTEIQTEDGDLTALPNNMLASEAVTVIQSSGTLIAATVSLGYDVDRSGIEALLLAAAEEAELEEPFVHVTDLGDFSVSYRAAGFLSDVKRLLRARSRLRSAMLDKLHAAGIEIVSPTFMNQRRISEQDRFIPRVGRRAAEPVDDVPAELVFDKAERAGRIEELRDRRTTLGEEIAELDEAIKSAGDDAPRIERRRAAAQRLLEHVEYLLDTLEGPGA